VYLHEDQCPFLIISRSIQLRMRNVSDKIVEKMKNNFFIQQLSSKIVSFKRKCGKNIVQRGRPHLTIWRMRIACGIPKTTNTHTHVV
jgi:hypothetical protein